MREITILFWIWSYKFFSINQFIPLGANVYCKVYCVYSNDRQIQRPIVYCPCSVQIVSFKIKNRGLAAALQPEKAWNVMCDVIKIRLKRKDERRSGRGTPKKRDGFLCGHILGFLVSRLQSFYNFKESAGRPKLTHLEQSLFSKKNCKAIQMV